MKTRIRKWGKNLTLVIPKPFAAALALKQGMSVGMSVADGKLIIEPELTLEYLLAQVTERNLHQNVDTGPAMGNEAW